MTLGKLFHLSGSLIFMSSGDNVRTYTKGLWSGVDEMTHVKQVAYTARIQCVFAPDIIFGSFLSDESL